jgi:hypothetical protein
LQGRQERTDDPSAKEKCLPNRSLYGASPQEDSLDVANAEPSHHATVGIDGGKTQDDAASGAKFFVATLNEEDDRFIRTGLESGDGFASSTGRLGSVADAVDDSNQDALVIGANQIVIAGFLLAREDEFGHAQIEARRRES